MKGEIEHRAEEKKQEKKKVDKEEKKAKEKSEKKPEKKAGKKTEEKAAQKEDKKSKVKTEQKAEQKPDKKTEQKAEKKAEEKQDAKEAEQKEKKKAPLEKPLEKMTIKELREIAKKIPDIIGVHGMNKPELYSAILKARGLDDKPLKKKADDSVRGIKKKIRAFKAERKTALEAKGKKMAKIYKRRISRLKGKLRRAA